MNANIILCLLAIVFCIAFSYKTKVHCGILGATCAMLIGTVGVGLRMNAVLAFWPMNILYYMMVINLFYGYAVNNGTMDVFAQKLLRLVKGKGALLIPVATLLCAVLGFSGAQPIPIVGPLLFTLALAVDMNPLAMAFTIACANNLGSDNPLTGNGGIVSTNLLATAGYENATAMGMGVYANAFLKQFLMIVVVFIFFRVWKSAKALEDLGEAPKFNEVQKKNITLVGVIIVFTLVFQILAALVKGNAFIDLMGKIAQPQIVFTAGIVIADLMKLGKFREATNRVPWNTIMLVGGMTMLMQVASAAGMVDAVAEIMTNNFPTFLIPGALCLFAGFLSFFSGGISVVCPLLYPIAAGMAAASDLNAVALCSAIFVGAMSTAISPFSTAGSQLLASVPDEEWQDKMYIPQMIWAVGVLIVASILSSLGLWNIIGNMIPVF